MFGLVVRFDCRDEVAAQGFDELTAQTVERIAVAEPGTLVYATYAVQGEPLARVFYELYQDAGAFAEHERQPHVRRFLAEREQFLVSHRVERLTPGPAKGVGSG